MIPQVLPDWFAPACAEVRSAWGAGRLAHGLVVHEDPGAGGAEFARWVTQLVNCRHAKRAPCGECQECRWVESGQHPDLTLVGPEDGSVQILIEQVRALVADLALTAHGNGYKVAIVSPAEAMNVNAANALLKTLEEPPPRTLLLLVTSQPSRLLPTIRSRCSKLRLTGPTREAGAQYLREVRGEGPWADALAATETGPFALLDADPEALARLRHDTLETLRDIGGGKIQPPGVAERWADRSHQKDLAVRLACLESWVTDRILETASIRDATHLSPPGLAPNICRLFELSDAIRDMRKLSLTSINKGMAVESLLWRWARQ